MTLNPRGYAVAERFAGGAVVRDAGTLAAGDLLKLRLHRGSARCRVEEAEAS